MTITAEGQGDRQAPKGDIRWLLEHGDEGERAYSALVDCASAVAISDHTADLSDHIKRMRTVVSEYYNRFAAQSKKPTVDAVNQVELLGLARDVADFFYGHRQR